MHELRSWINQVYEGEFKNAKTPQEIGEARERFHAITRDEENELVALLQQGRIDALRRKGIEIPEKYLNGEEYPLKRTLLPSGEIWARNELSKYRDSRIEFWSKIILPIISLILSIWALFKSTCR